MSYQGPSRAPSPAFHAQGSPAPSSPSPCPPAAGASIGRLGQEMRETRVSMCSPGGGSPSSSFCPTRVGPLVCGLQFSPLLEPCRHSGLLAPGNMGGLITLDPCGTREAAGPRW